MDATDIRCADVVWIQMIHDIAQYYAVRNREIYFTIYNIYEGLSASKKGVDVFN
jgi:hypothetical protein